MLARTGFAVLSFRRWMWLLCLGVGLGWVVTVVAQAGPAAEPDVEALTRLNLAQRHELVAAHNRWRAGVGVPPLSWSDELAQSSAQWADQISQGRECRLQHSAAAGIGENLYWASPVQWSDGKRAVQNIPAGFVVDVWGGEAGDFDLSTNTCRIGKVCGHFTQVVWRNTQEVGCAMRVCGAKDQVWVCQYRPAGNYLGQRPY